MFRLGVAVKILGRGGMQARDARRPESSPHLSVSLIYLRDVLFYLGEQRIACYRLADDLAPYIMRPDLPQFHDQIDACRDLLAATGELAHSLGIRLTMHLGMHVAPGSADDTIGAQSLFAVGMAARILDALGCGADSILVVHVGGRHDDRPASLHRFAVRFERLPESVRRRVAVEVGDHGFDLRDLLWLHRMTGVPVVLDTLHMQINNPTRIGMAEALGLALATWPRGIRPKVHFSTQRTEAHLMPGKHGEQRVIGPRHGQHADYLNPFEFSRFIIDARGMPEFDIMLEAKASDLALIRLREDLHVFAPEIAMLVE